MARPMTTNAPDAIPADVMDLARHLADKQELSLLHEDLIVHAIMADRASRAPLAAPVAEGGWRDDPSADERWNAGLDYAMTQFCEALAVDPAMVTWDAATETLDGDVRSVIGNILRAWSGEDWIDLPATRELLLAGQGDDDGMQSLPDFEEGDTVLVMVDRCLHLLERRRDIIEGSLAAPTPPSANSAQDVGELVAAVEDALETASDSYRAGNGRQMGIQADDGEKCWIVHSDQIEALRAALAAYKRSATDGKS